MEIKIGLYGEIIYICIFSGREFILSLLLRELLKSQVDHHIETQSLGEFLI